MVILLVHSIPGMFNNGIQDFGNLYLNTIGFAPLGVPLAWAIKLSHVACAVALGLDRWVRPTVYITLLVLTAGIFMVHLPHGWFVVGGGRNGIEFNFLLLFVLMAILWPDRRNTH
jgi:putative oxidoreductase